jgi:hypothetical protein
VALVVAALASGPHDARAQCGPLLPPNAHLNGKSFDEWNVLYTKWAVAIQLGGQTPSDTVDGVRFLPARTTPGTYEFDVTLKPGTPFVAPPYPVFGETYDNGTQDVPDEPTMDFLFDNADVRVVLDGKTLMDDTADELAKYQYGPVYFDRPIVYAAPQDRGGANSTSAIWTVGVAAVYHPLPVGRHTLVNIASGPLGDYRTTYHITVSPH